MADWRQIQARIRKAKVASEPLTQLAELYERTRDAMVAFELATIQEKAGANDEAVRWYTTAAERFRRAQWRTKAEEALTRLGAPIPVAGAPSASLASASEAAPPEEGAPQQLQLVDIEVTEEQVTEAPGEPVPEGAQSSPSAAGAASRSRRRRGRRGGRRHRGARNGQPSEGASATPAFSGAAEVSRPQSSAPVPFRPSPATREADPESEPEPAPVHERPRQSAFASAAYAPSRAGEPALASRLALLESQLRRLLACPQASLDDAEQAPAGPGVLLLSDSDQHTHYYIEACQTLRIGIGNLLRGGRGSKDGGRLKSSMAEDLGIAESRVSKYLKDHCAVRWLQLDEGAPDLAHFAIAVLRPVVNE